MLKSKICPTQGTLIPFFITPNMLRCGANNAQHLGPLNCHIKIEQNSSWKKHFFISKYSTFSNFGYPKGLIHNYFYNYLFSNKIKRFLNCIILHMSSYSHRGSNPVRFLQQGTLHSICSVLVGSNIIQLL